MRDGSCAEAAINAASSRLSSSTDFPKYTSAADSTPYALFPKKVMVWGDAFWISYTPDITKLGLPITLPLIFCVITILRTKRAGEQVEIEILRESQAITLVFELDLRPSDV